MHLETIRDFEWRNEPEFRVEREGLVISSAAGTDFWQDARRQISRDNGHFFFGNCRGDFKMKAEWQIPPNMPEWCQCGLMGRVDARNWCKISMVKDKNQRQFVAVTVTNLGYSDLAMLPLREEIATMAYSLEAADGDLYLAYAVNGRNWVRARRFQMIAGLAELKVGAYICNPRAAEFAAVLSDINFY